MKKKREKEKALGAYTKQYKQRCHVVSTVTNLVIISVLRTKVNKKMMKKEKKMTSKEVFWWNMLSLWKERTYISKDCHFRKM